jgi:nicotinamide-nucleotide amidase
VTEAVDLGNELQQVVCDSGLTVAVAESLTCGALASAFGQSPSSSDWFVGGVVAYSTRVKVEVLGVADGPVVNAETAEQMARGVGQLLKADLAVATTGVGGPGAKEGQPPGTVWIGVWSARDCHSAHFLFPGEPGDVVEAATARAVAMALDEARELARG